MTSGYSGKDGDDIIYAIGRRIAADCPMRRSFLDVQFLFPELGQEDLSWLPRIFEVARDSAAFPIPVATLSDILGPRGEAFHLALARQSDIQLAIRVVSGEIDSELPARIASSMRQLGTTPGNCALILDFGDADLSDVEAVAIIALDAVERVQSMGLWRQVVFQGTNYPEKNPAGDDSSVSVPRNEWLAWRAAIRSEAKMSDSLIFGDYGADCAKFEFGSGGGAVPIRHYRYCTPENWLVVRGKSDGKVKSAMRDICQKIVNSGQFAGRDFSSADEYIYQTAMGGSGPGNATTWREINTAHHITRVVVDIGSIQGDRVARRTIKGKQEQITLFGDDVR